MDLLGRSAELHRLALLVGGARNGVGGALVLRGDAGIGKTTVLCAGTRDREGITSVSMIGYDAESAMPYAAVQRLVTPLAAHLDSLPPTQLDALRVASGDAPGEPPDRYLVGLGLLGLLAAAGDVTPVVCAIDDAHLLDPESLDVLAFVARRLTADPAALVLAGRDTADFRRRTVGIPDVRLRGLRPLDALALLRRSLDEDIDPAIAMDVVAATGGNPLALVDLGVELTASQLTDASVTNVPIPIGRHLEDHYLDVITRLGSDVRLWLLIAAAESTGDLQLIGAAAERLGLDDAARDAAEEVGIVELTSQVRFRHPLVRCAAYHAAAGGQRRRVHATLAKVAQRHGSADLEAWHAARAVLGPDERVAAKLEHTARAAADRGGSASRARVLAQAATLSAPGPRRSARLVSAAEAALAAGSGHLAGQLIGDVDPGGLDPVTRGRLHATHARLASYDAGTALPRSTSQLLEAATQLRGHDDLLEQTTLVHAWEHAMMAERDIEVVSWRDLGERLRALAARREGAAGPVLEGLSALLLLPYREAVPVMRKAVAAFADLDSAGLLTFGVSSFALTTALWDLHARTSILERTAGAARRAGELHLLDTVVRTQSLAEAVGGTPARAAALHAEWKDLRRGMGRDTEGVADVPVLVWGSASPDELDVVAAASLARGFRGAHSLSSLSLASVDNADGRYSRAHDRLLGLVERPFLHVTPVCLPDFIEACVRTGRDEEAHRRLEELDERTDACGSIWARGVAARSRALLSGVGDAEQHHLAAIELLEQAGATVDSGRARLVYGEWLRRAKRPSKAVEQLREAARILDDAGATPLAERARRELSATSPRSRRAGGEQPWELTSQERTVAQLAAQGRTNAEIGATMFLSTNTVDYHLRKVFNKLSISSRRQLAERLSV